MSCLKRKHKESQKDWILRNLEKRGWITRNEALKQFCSRLGARINDLKNDGYYIVSTYGTSGRLKNDYIYFLKKGGK